MTSSNNAWEQGHNSETGTSWWRKSFSDLDDDLFVECLEKVFDCTCTSRDYETWSDDYGFDARPDCGIMNDVVWGPLTYYWTWCFSNGLTLTSTSEELFSKKALLELFAEQNSGLSAEQFTKLVTETMTEYEKAIQEKNKADKDDNPLSDSVVGGNRRQNAPTASTEKPITDNKEQK